MTVGLILTKDAQPGHYQIVVTTPSGPSDTVSSGGNFIVQAPLSLEAIRGASGTFGFRVKGVLDRGFVVETSLNLNTWSSMLTNIAPSGTWETNGIPMSTGGGSFYRAMLGQ